MLERVAPLIDVWHLTDLPTPRAASAESIRSALEAGVLGRGRVAGCHPEPMAALHAAAAEADPADRIVVFGSFFTVGGVLHSGIPRLAAKHLGA